MSLTAAFAAALGLVAADIVLRAVRLRVLLGRAQAPKLIDAIAANAYGDAASAVTPARLGGEPARFVGLRSARVPTPAAIVVLAAERIVDLSLVALVTAVSLGLLGTRGFAEVAALVRRFVSADMVPWVTGVALATVVAGVVAYRLRHRFPPVVEQSLGEAWRETRRLSIKTIAVAAGLTAVSMLLRVSILPALLAAYTPIEDPASVMIGSFALIYSQLLLPTPAGAGGVEVGFVAGFASSLSGAEVASLLVTWRVFSLVLPAGLGGVLLLRDLLRRRRSAQTAAVLVGVLLALPGRSVAQEGSGLGVPIVDLADDTARQTVVDREPGQYLGHPTTVLLEDGRTILAVYPKGHGGGAIVLKRSDDGGRVWSERLPVPANWVTSREVPTIHRVVDRAGVRRLILFSGLYPIRMAVSEDDGGTWTPLAPIGDFGGIVAMASVERLADGAYMALFHDDGRFLRDSGERSTFQVFKTLSHDGGLTWGDPVPIAELAGADLCEPGLVRSPDGTQIAVLLRENSRRHNSYVIFSEDEGETWSAPRELPAALTGDRHTARYARDGRLFITFRDQAAGSPTWGDWVGWVGTYDDIVSGRDGQYRVRIMDNTKDADTAYPGLELLPDGTFVTTTYGHWTEGEQPYIVSVRFTLEELDGRLAHR